MKRLMIVADHSFVVQAIRLALRQTAGFQVVGFFDGRGSVRNALHRAEARTSSSSTTCRRPRTRWPACARSREEAPQAKALLLTLQMDSDWLEQAFEAGAHAVVSKTVHPVSLGTLLREISHGNVVHRFEKRPAAVDRARTAR